MKKINHLVIYACLSLNLWGCSNTEADPAVIATDLSVESISATRENDIIKETMPMNLETTSPLPQATLAENQLLSIAQKSGDNEQVEVINLTAEPNVDFYLTTNNYINNFKLVAITNNGEEIIKDSILYEKDRLEPGLSLHVFTYLPSNFSNLAITYSDSADQEIMQLLTYNLDTGEVVLEPVNGFSSPDQLETELIIYSPDEIDPNQFTDNITLTLAESSNADFVVAASQELSNMVIYQVQYDGDNYKVEETIYQTKLFDITECLEISTYLPSNYSNLIITYDNQDGIQKQYLLILNMDTERVVLEQLTEGLIFDRN